MTTKTKDTPVVGTNSQTIPWPQDPQGALADLKKGGIVAARRVGGNREKLDKLLESLDLIKRHAVARFKADVATRKEAKDNAAGARARVADKRVRQAEAQAREFEKRAEEIRKQHGVPAPVAEVTETEGNS